MTGFRGSDETLDREIEALEAAARLRIRRTARDLQDVDRELRVLRLERARRRAVAEGFTVATASAETSSELSSS
jgi:hypothetical protein